MDAAAAAWGGGGGRATEARPLAAAAAAAADAAADAAAAASATAGTRGGLRRIWRGTVEATTGCERGGKKKRRVKRNERITRLAQERFNEWTLRVQPHVRGGVLGRRAQARQGGDDKVASRRNGASG